jgi:hypothetical protein
MTRLYFEPITVECDAEGTDPSTMGRPRSFIWRGKAHRITTVLKRWIVRADWWRQEVSRQYYKVECDNLGTYEIYQERDAWFLERLYD